MANGTPSTISILVPADEQDRFGGRVRRKEVPVADLQDSLKGFLANMEAAIDGVPDSMSGYHIDEITLSLEISATGKVSMLGTGAEVSGTGGLTLTLRRRAGDGTPG